MEQLCHLGKIIVGGKINKATHICKPNGVVVLAGAVGRAEMLGGHVGVFQNIKHLGKPRLAPASVHMHHAGLSGKQGRLADIRSKAGQLLGCYYRVAVVADGNFYPKAFFNKGNILFYRACYRWGGVFVSPGKAVGGEAVLVKPLCFCN